MFQQDGTPAHRHATPSLSWSERDAINASSSRRLCPSTLGTLRARILTILSVTTNKSAKQVYRRRYESRRSSKPKLHLKKIIIKLGEKRFSIWRMEFLHPVMWHVALKSWQWIHQAAAPCNVIYGSGMTCHRIRRNVRHIRILRLVSILTTSPPSTCHSAPVSEILSKSEYYRTIVGRKKWRHIDFQDGGSQPS